MQKMEHQHNVPYLNILFKFYSIIFQIRNIELKDILTNYLFSCCKDSLENLNISPTERNYCYMIWSYLYSNHCNLVGLPISFNVETEIFCIFKCRQFIYSWLEIIKFWWNLCSFYQIRYSNRNIILVSHHVSRM